jgi:hypothetical protein
MARDRLARDDGAQMMLLAAVILLIGFIALAGMVGRVSQLGVQTGREQQRPILLEVSPMKAGIDAAIARLVSELGFQDDTTAHRAIYEAAIKATLDHLRALEASRGFLLEYTLGCATPGDPTTGHATVSLTDGELWVQVQSAAFKRPAC